MLQPMAVSVKPLKNYKIRVKFDNGEEKIYDVSPHIRGTLYGKLKDSHYFNGVQVVDGYVEWADGQDIAAHDLYGFSVSAES
ncbi:hypothetical protein FACS1894133_3480 [Clostridia bacterium]|nr:hypothetical protein FACS1894133_3480 [Clostridia bacterium]